MSKNKIALAYSGGLDTSFCIPFLIDHGFEVHAVHINTGGFHTEEVADLLQKARTLGAVEAESIHIENEYYQKCVKYLLFGNILRNNNYPLSVSSERPFQALALLQYCRQKKILHMAHGSTGAGNDQIRFDIIFKSLAPEIEIITPIRDHTFSRVEEIEYLQSKGFEWSQEKAQYSVNQGLWGTSVGGKETLTSHLSLPEEAYPSPLSQNQNIQIKLTFEKGEIQAIDGEEMKPLEAIKKLNKIASKFAIGRDIHVGDTIIGIKGRVGFEAAAPLVLIKAHELLEKHVLSKHQIFWKKQLSDWYGMMLHEGNYLEPALRNIETYLEESQQFVSGMVAVKLLPYTFQLLGVSSPHDLMQSSFAQYGEENHKWTAEEAKGFIKIRSNAAQLFYSVHPNEIPC